MTFLDALAAIPKPATLKTPCPGCDGTGAITHESHRGPDARAVTCQACLGECEVDALCQCCIAKDRPAVARVLVPGDTETTDMCAECKADFDAVEDCGPQGASVAVDMPGLPESFGAYLEAVTGLNFATAVRR